MTWEKLRLQLRKTSQVQNFTFDFVGSKLEKLNIFLFQIMFACTFCLNFNKRQVIKGKGVFYDNWEVPGLRLQLRALKKLKLQLRRALKNSKLRLQLRDLTKVSASLRLHNSGFIPMSEQLHFTARVCIFLYFRFNRDVHGRDRVKR